MNVIDIYEKTEKLAKELGKTRRLLGFFVVASAYLHYKELQNLGSMKTKIEELERIGAATDYEEGDTFEE
jgi:hypothetical protein